MLMFSLVVFPLLSTLHLLVLSSILPICCSHLWPLALSTTSFLLWPKKSYCVDRYLGSHCLAFGLQTPYGWCQTILNIFFVKLLLCKPIWIAHQIYLILSSRVASDFFCLHHDFRFVYARIKYFLSLAFYPCCIFQCLYEKNEEN
jgi:hypothetical protein